MQLSELMTGIDGEVYNFKDVVIESLEFDSRRVKHGSLFIAIEGKRFDGHKFIKDAEDRGAVAVISQRRVETDLPQIIFNDTRWAMGKLAKKFYGSFDDLIKIGITGTNGKTTSAFLIQSISREAGRNPGLIGTIYYLGKTKMKAERTTPESLDLFKLFDKFRNEGAKDVIMEVSSHALSLRRVDEVKLQIAVFTNLSQDHLDFHKTIDDYKRAKLHIFELLDEKGFAIFNLDDPISVEIESLDLKKKITYGIEKRGDIWARILENNIDGLKIEIYYKNRSYKIFSKLIGEYNCYNILASFATGVALDISCETIIAGIERVESIKGRTQQVAPNIFVDFAHTPKALENVLQTLMRYTKGRLIVIFGCGGDRDKDKRPKMGRVASTIADLSILTSDNPRSETPMEIIKDIEQGMVNKDYKIIEDRKEAINYGISIKEPDDIVLIAGKGHEEYQIIKNRVIDFDDAEVVGECLKNLP